MHLLSSYLILNYFKYIYNDGLEDGLEVCLSHLKVQNKTDLRY